MIGVDAFGKGTAKPNEVTLRRQWFFGVSDVVPGVSEGGETHPGDYQGNGMGRR